MFRSLSLTSRLTLFYTAVAAAIVLGLGVFIMFAIDRHFVDLDRVTLQDKQSLAADIFASAESVEDAKWRLGEALDHHHGLYVLVRDAQGAPIFQSKAFTPPPSAQAGPDGVLQRWRHDGRGFIALRSSAQPAYRPATRMDVLVAIDTVHHEQFLQELRRTLTLYSLLAVVISGLLGWFAAHQGLAPLRHMQSRATAVSGHRLDARMPVASVPVEMAELARELNGMLDRLQEDFKRLSEFSSDLAHELRTPISNLLTQTQVVLSTPRDVDTYREVLASNAEEFQRMARMVSDMLFLAKTEHGVDLPHRERFSAAREVRALIEFYDAVADEKHIRLTLSGDGDILGDRLMFRRAVSNLLSNALRHSKAHHEVRVEIRSAADATVVAVENAGDDIDPKLLPRLFDRFYRIDPARPHPDADGSGLGLAITRAIVKAHGGEASASSGQGMTRFSLAFPHPSSETSLPEGVRG